MDPVTLPVTEARAQLADLVGRVQHAGERVVLSRHGVPVAALVPIADLDVVDAHDRAVRAAEHAAIERSFTVTGAAESIWDTLVQHTLRQRWWPGVLLPDWVGGELVSEDETAAVHAEVTELVEIQLLVLTWREEGQSTPSIVRIALNEVAGSTTVVLTHAGLPPADLGRYTATWTTRCDAWRDRFSDAPTRLPW